MAPSDLSPFSLPLRFTLLPSLAHPTTPCACLSVQLPLRQPGAPPHQPNQPAFTVTRILDPEHKEPFVALGPILAASDLTPLEGLLLFGLRTPAYDLNLGGVAPFKDIWVPLKLARSCAARLDMLDELDGLLEWRSRSAWTVEDKEEGGLVSNWKIGSDRVDPAEYSTSAMLSTTFPQIHLLPSGTQVRTFVPPEFGDAPATARAAPLLAGGFVELHRRLVEWATREWEDWLEAEEYDDRSEASESRTNGNEQDLLATSFFSTGLSLLALIDGLPPEALDHAPPGSSVVIAPARRFPEVDRAAVGARSTGSDLSRVSPLPLGLVEVPTELELTRHELLTGSGKARLALVDFLSRLIAREWTRALELALTATSDPKVSTAAAEARLVSTTGGVSMEQFAQLVARVEALESAAMPVAGTAEVNPKPPLAVQPEIRSNSAGTDGRPLSELEAENARLRERLKELSDARVATAEVVKAPEWMTQLPILVVVGIGLWWWRQQSGT